MYLLPLIVIIFLVLFLPFFVHKVENNLEVFLFFMGLLSILSSCLFKKIEVSPHTFIKAAEEPLKITLAVLISGWLFRRYREKITSFIVNLEEKIGPHIFATLFVFILGLLSSVITAIIASIVLVEVISALKLHRDFERKLTVLTCYSIGLGAALTPVGEPLSTIAVSKLRGEPYHADFFFLLRHLGIYIIPGIFAISLYAGLIHASAGRILTLKEKSEEALKDILIRAVKVYVFVMGLVFLSEGFKPVVDEYISKVSAPVLYWVNLISAILDNATLTAAEISPLMEITQIKALLMGLLISGGLLIPGNIPNIISAGKLGIKSKEWARDAFLPGVILLLLYFAILFFV